MALSPSAVRMSIGASATDCATAAVLLVLHRGSTASDTPSAVARADAWDSSYVEQHRCGWRLAEGRSEGRRKGAVKRTEQ